MDISYIQLNILSFYLSLFSLSLWKEGYFMTWKWEGFLCAKRKWFKDNGCTGLLGHVEEFVHSLRAAVLHWIVKM